jgi:hypothetical protein
MNELPTLHPCSFFTPHPKPGLRGLITSIHPSLASSTTFHQGYNTDDDYQLTHIALHPHNLYIFNIYFSKNGADIPKSRASLLHPQNDAVVIAGDFNHDPFTGRGPLGSALRHLKAAGVTPVLKPYPGAHTRPSSKSHIDNIYVNNTAAKMLQPPGISYYHENKIGSSAGLSLALPQATSKEDAPKQANQVEHCPPRELLGQNPIPSHSN